MIHLNAPQPLISSEIWVISAKIETFFSAISTTQVLVLCSNVACGALETELHFNPRVFLTKCMDANKGQHTNHITADYTSLLDAATPEQLVVAHSGVFSADDVNGIAFELEQKLRDAGERKGVVKRLFSILIEALQNIRLHGEPHPDGTAAAYLIVTRIAEGYLLQSANLIRSELVDSMTKRLNDLNMLEPVDLKQHYVEVLTNGQISQKGGAGLGFITIAMKSKNSLEFNFKPCNDVAGLDVFEVATLVKV